MCVGVCAYVEAISVLYNMKCKVICGVPFVINRNLTRILLLRASLTLMERITGLTLFCRPCETAKEDLKKVFEPTRKDDPRAEFN